MARERKHGWHKRTDEKRMGAKKKYTDGRRIVKPAPIYDVVGWVTEHEAAELKNKIDPPETGIINRSTISRWRGQNMIHAIDINQTLILVNLAEIKNFPGIPLGNPALVYDKYPPEVDSLPDEITITLRRRKTVDPPNKIRPEWDK